MSVYCRQSSPDRTISKYNLGTLGPVHYIIDVICRDRSRRTHSHEWLCKLDRSRGLIPWTITVM